MVFFYFNSKRELYRDTLISINMELLEMLVEMSHPWGDLTAFIRTSSSKYIAFPRNPLKMKLLLQSIDVLADSEIRDDMAYVLESSCQFIYLLLEGGQQRGEISHNVKLDTVTVFFLGLFFAISCAEFLGLNWFKAGDDIFTIRDHFIDSVPRAGNGSLKPRAYKQT